MSIRHLQKRVTRLDETAEPDARFLSTCQITNLLAIPDPTFAKPTTASPLLRSNRIAVCRSCHGVIRQGEQIRLDGPGTYHDGCEQ